MRDHIHRGPLLSRLDGALACRLTVVHAPAGYGKTSLLSQWTSRAAGNALVASVSLKRDDTDVRNLTRGILQSVAKAGEGVAGSRHRPLDQPYPSRTEQRRQWRLHGRPGPPRRRAPAKGGGLRKR